MPEQELEALTALAFGSVAALRAIGFDGFVSVRNLRADRLRSVPVSAGVYVLVCDSSTPPAFLEYSPAGALNGRDPTISVDELQESWVPAARVVYIGKAGGTGVATGLRRRLSAYFRHGAGHRVGHWGGRAVWQLCDADELLVAWCADLDCEPREFERFLLEQFVERYRARPFANRSR